MSRKAYIGVNGVARNIPKMYVGDNVARKITKGYVGVNGVARQFFSSGTPLSSLAVGSSIYLNENGSPIKYLVVHQGKPSSLYDDSCNGTWLLRNAVYQSLVWNDSKQNSYKDSTIHSYLNSTFLNLFDENIRAQIKTVKIPYVNGTGSSDIASGANGLSCKVFLLSGYEVGFTNEMLLPNIRYLPIDGAKLDYFESGIDTSANAKRIARIEGIPDYWFTRSPFTANYRDAYLVTNQGSWTNELVDEHEGIRPALVLPSDTLINTSTNTIII